MKLPRDLSGEILAKALEKLGYTIDRHTTQKYSGICTGYLCYAITNP